MKACLKGLFPLIHSFIYYSFTEMQFEFHKIQRQERSLGVMKYSEADCSSSCTNLYIC